MRSILLTGAAVLGFAGLSVPALARTPDAHTITLEVPGGTLVRIQYTGERPPSVSFVPSRGPGPSLAALPPFFGPHSPFALMQAMAAQMSRETTVLLREARATTAALMAHPLTPAALEKLGSVGSGYTIISAGSGDGLCTESVQVTYAGNAAPKVVSYRAGDCARARGTPTLRDLPRSVPPEADTPETTLASAAAPLAYEHLTRPIAWRH